MSSQTFFVTGATGSQGGAVARKLLESGHNVRALVRDPSKAAAIALQKQGAVLIQGDYTNITAIQEAAQGCVGVFFLPMPSAESVQDAKNIISGSKAAGVEKIVVSTVARAEEGEKFAAILPGNASMAMYWHDKKAVQEAVQSAGFESWTVLQPGWLMTNWITPMSHFYFAELKRERILVMSVGEDTELDMTDPEDVGSFAVKALVEDGSALENKVVGVASEKLTIRQCAKALAETTGVDVGWKIKSDEEVEREKNSNPLVASQIWGKVEGTHIDIGKAKSYGVPLTTFRQFLEAHKDQVLAAVQD